MFNWRIGSTIIWVVISIINKANMTTKEKLIQKLTKILKVKGSKMGFYKNSTSIGTDLFYDEMTMIIDSLKNKVDAESLAKERAVEFDAVKKEITRLQEKYDENGYDCSPMIKLKRIESHVDMAFKIYSQELNKALAEKRKEGAE